MNWVKSLFGSKEKGLTQDDVLRILGTGKEDGPFPAFSDKTKLAMIQNNSLAYACVNKIATSYAEAPLVVEAYDATNDRWVIQKDSPYMQPFVMNPHVSENDYKQYSQLHIQATGKAYLWKWRSDDKVVRELWPVPPHWVTPNLVESLGLAPDSPRVIESFTIKTEQGKEWTVPVDDMVYTKFPHPMNLWDGLAPMEAAIRHIYLDQKATEYKAESVTSLATPGIVVKTRKAMGPSQKADLRAALRRKTGTDPRASAFLISGDEASIDFIDPLSSFDWSTYGDIDESRVCACFQVPPIVVGLWVGLKNSPWSNTGEAKRWFYTSTLAGLWQSFADSYTSQLIPPELQGQIRYCFDTTDIKELQEDEDQRAERAGKLFDRGVITRAMAKEIIGEESTDDDMVYKYNASTMLVPEGESAEMGMGALTEIPLDEQLQTEETL